MPTPDQCSGSNSPMHTAGENAKETNSNQIDTNKRFAVSCSYICRPQSFMIILMHCRNKVIQDLLEHKQKQLSGSLLATYFYNCMHIATTIIIYYCFYTECHMQGYHIVDIDQT